MTDYEEVIGPDVLRPEDLQWEWFHVHGDSAQWDNRGVKVRHIPSGKGGIGALPQSRLANQALALDRLRGAIAEYTTTQEGR